MSKSTSGSTGGLMDTEPGGEQTQYEGTHTFMQPHGKETGQQGNSSESTSVAGLEGSGKGSDGSRGQQTSDNIRYGQNVSESGMGGMTKGMGGSAEQDGGFGGVAAKEGEDDVQQSRREQGYGGGSGVGG